MHADKLDVYSACTNRERERERERERTKVEWYITWPRRIHGHATSNNRW